jgi:hypothetical protein
MSSLLSISFNFVSICIIGYFLLWWGSTQLRFAIFNQIVIIKQHKHYYGTYIWFHHWQKTHFQQHFNKFNPFQTTFQSSHRPNFIDMIKHPSLDVTNINLCHFNCNNKFVYFIVSILFNIWINTSNVIWLFSHIISFLRLISPIPLHTFCVIPL